MAAQYDTIVPEYEEIRSKDNVKEMTEMENVKQAISPFVTDASVLELACGSGFYSHELLNWGAKCVYGVDVSSEMIDVANKSLELEQNSKDPEKRNRLAFAVADCSIPILYPDAPYDLVFAAWLLTFAPGFKTLRNMFKNVFMNLKEGGHFVTVCSPPVDDQKEYFMKEQEVRKDLKIKGIFYRELLDEFKSGIKYRVYCNPQKNKFFDSFRLNKQTYVDAAKAAGFTNGITWREVQVPEKFDANEDLRKLFTVPDFGIIVLRK